MPLPAKRKVQEAAADEILKAEVAKSGGEVARAYQVVTTEKCKMGKYLKLGKLVYIITEHPHRLPRRRPPLRLVRLRDGQGTLAQGQALDQVAGKGGAQDGVGAGKGKRLITSPPYDFSKCWWFF